MLTMCAAAAACGAAGAFLYDPRLGRRRRHWLRDRSLAATRRTWRRGRRAERMLMSRGRGRMLGAMHRHEQPKSYDDATLVSKVSSEVFRDPWVPKGRLNIDACEGVVTLRGMVDDQRSIDRIVELTSRVQGVRGVESLLHLPETPAPHLNGDRARA
jgi:hypothetical protein